MKPYNELRIERARFYAQLMHDGQVRKYTGEPYVEHCFAVYDAMKDDHYSEDTLIAALLHDTVEDTKATLDDIEKWFGPKVAGFVSELTDPPKYAGTRAERKAMVITKFQRASYGAKCIKCYDIANNLPSVVEHDLKFAEVFVAEVMALMPVLKEGAARQAYEKMHAAWMDAVRALERAALAEQTKENAVGNT